MIPVSEEDAAFIAGRFPDLPSEAFETDAIRLLRPDATEAQWLAKRRGGIGASELAVVMGRSPYASPFSLWHAKRGGWDLPSTEEQRVGLALENAVADMWAHENDYRYHVARPSSRLWSHPAYPWLMCSPDRLAMSDEGMWIPVEVKTDEGGKDWGPPDSDIVPFHHRVQLAVQCAIFDAPYGYIARLGRKTSGRKYTTYMVEFNPGEFTEWLVHGLAFMDSLRDNRPPEVDAHSATTDALQRLYPLSGDEESVAVIPRDVAALWSVRRDALAEAKRLSKLADNKLREAMGDAVVAITPDGYKFAKRSVYERSGYTTKPTTVDQLRRVEDGHIE